MCAAGPGCDAPVNGSNIIARLVPSHFFKIDATPAEIGFVGPGQIAQSAFFAPKLELLGGKAQGNELVQLHIGAASRSINVGQVHA